MADLAPEDPVVLFDEDGHMWWIGDSAIAEDLIESPDDYALGYDGLGRQLHIEWISGRARLEVTSEKSYEADVRRHVAAYYLRFARIQGLEPPNKADIQEFLYAVADDRIEE